MRFVRKVLISVFVFGIFLLVGSYVFAQTQESESSNYFCAVYFSGIGCPHCAKTDPFIFEKIIKNHKKLIVLDYEVYHQSINAKVLDRYITLAQLPDYKKGIPAIYFNDSNNAVIVGDKPIIDNLEKIISTKNKNNCLLFDGRKEPIENVRLELLPGFPKIWRGDRVLIKKDDDTWIFAWNGSKIRARKDERENSPDVLKKLILSDNYLEILESVSYSTLPHINVALSGKKISFENAVALKVKSRVSILNNTIFVGKIISLALADSVNPCALAVLALMLVAILTYNPEKRNKVLLAGFAFISSVFLMYFLYGLIIIRFFRLIEALTYVRFYLYKILGGIAVLLGIFNIKDFIKYKPGGFLTEMPLFLRPKLKKVISGVTSPKGAFLTGLFVTLFLLPCTIGPYIIAGGILSAVEIVKTIPWLLLYNLIFVFPMMIIVFLIYLGLTKIEDVSAWRDRNIRYLHLIAGLIILGLGILMLLGIG